MGLRFSTSQIDRLALAGLLLVATAALSACAAGSPGVVEPPVTRTPVQIAAVFDPTATSTVPPAATIPVSVTPSTEPSFASPSPVATLPPTPRPTRTPTPGPTARPEPPEPSDPAMSEVYDLATNGRPEVALTFDAGSDRGNAELILDILKQRKVKASFGITGQWAEENPDLVKRMVDEGHMVFNHTWSHSSFTGFSTGDPSSAVLDKADRVKELDDTADAISEATGGYETAPYFRPPYGDYDDGALADLADAGYTVTIMWSCDSFGWDGATAEEIVAKCGVDTPPGAIILLHVGSASADAEALPALIDAIEDQDLTLVTVEELLQP